MRIPPVRSYLGCLAAAGALISVGPVSALAVTPLSWKQPAGSAPADEFHVYAGQTTSLGQLVYVGLPTPDGSGVYAADVQIDAIDQGVAVYVWVTAANAAGESAASNTNFYPACNPQLDSDCDGVPNANDNCPFTANPGQQDTGGLGPGSAPDGIGDACQCGDVNGDGRITNADSAIIRRSLMVPPLAVMAHPELCDVGGAAGCSNADSVIIQRALLVPPSATVRQVCAPALAPAP